MPTVLLADADRFEREVRSRQLACFGLTLEPADNGRECLFKLRQSLSRTIYRRIVNGRLSLAACSALEQRFQFERA